MKDLMNSKILRIKALISENRIIAALFLLSASYFIAQHFSHLSWDFISYQMNAEYWAGNGQYLEILRPPLISVLFFIFGALGREAAAILTILSVSVLFLYSTIRMADACRIDRKIMYGLSLNAFVLMFATFAGTELLMLALIELFITEIIESRPKEISGLFLGLAFLAKYTIMPFVALLLFHGKIEKIMKNAGIAALTVSPWLIANYLFTGNPLTSIADSYAQNIKLRSYIHMAPSIMHFLESANILLPLTILGITFSMASLRQQIRDTNIFSLKSLIEFLRTYKIGLIMVSVAILTVFTYITTPMKFDRYLFVLTIPLVFFAAEALKPRESMVLGMKLVMTEKHAKRIVIIIFALSISFCVALLPFGLKGELYDEALRKTNELGIDSCALKSNEWVFLNYKGRTAEIAPWPATVDSYLAQGYYLLLFKRAYEPDYTHNREFIDARKPLFENERGVILGNRAACAPLRPMTMTDRETVDEMMKIKYGYGIDKNPYRILFTDYGI